MAVASESGHLTWTGQQHYLPLNEMSSLKLESGAVLQQVGLAYESWGELDSDRKNAILLLHGFTGNSHAASSAEVGCRNPGWWEDLIGPGLALDTNRYFVVCPNVLGGCDGSTGPSSLDADGTPYGSRFPNLTVRDLVAAELRWADALGISRWHAVIGASLGGMRGLEWVITAPERLERLVLLATTPACSPQNHFFHSAQISAIESDLEFAGGDYYSSQCYPLRGLALARSIARMTYSCQDEWCELLSCISSVQPQAFLPDDAFSFARRFDANSYLVLTKAMNSHNIGRGRGGIKAALQRIRIPTMVISIQSDRLFPPADQELIARHISQATFASVQSADGHDGFLHEQSALDSLLRASLVSE